MRRVLIVDDEKLIRKGIRTILERNLGNLEITEAMNGKEALDLLLKDKYDILFIDIRLPVMDGITVLKKIQNIKQKPKIIIISGYDEFSYAKECMQLGARGYLLKPIDKKELLEFVQKLIYEIEEEEKSQRLLSFQRFMRTKMIESEVNNVIFSGIDINTFAKRLYDLDIKIDEQYLGIYLLFPLSNLDDNNFNFEEQKLNLNKIVPNDSYIITIYNQRRDMLILTKNLFSLQEINSLFENTYRKKVYIGIYNEMRRIDEIKLIYENASKAAIWAFLCQNQSEIYSNVLAKKYEALRISENIEKFKELILAGKRAEAIGFVENIFEKNILNFQLEDILNLTNEIYTKVIDWFCHHIPKKILDIHEFQNLNCIFNFQTFSEYVGHLKKFVIDSTKMISSLKGILNVKDEIDKAIDYINKNYNKDINMALVANYVSLNYYYFSTIFKEKTGMSFLDYLNKIRIEKAKELLVKTNLKIWEIAEKVGYKNPKHFARIFKDITGITPNEYRDAQKRLQK
ncbi:response regulator [Anaerocellum diazotrophicum]|uniref:DNA-binding response regulator n=1 Tax=Caldicellulosiruptor diazotrophicus TaxID=2806205 RepID=A0ABM7NJ20_9FIRM|nr:response regulator [Caldicellulosiruptor diazotrophicus]BCS80095.1 DNA-binding response regulator [Caldicellulosiruptor diazotrophicus]